MPGVMKDPVCDMTVEDRSVSFTHGQETFYFCSEVCRDTFAARPDLYLEAEAHSTESLSPARRRIAYFSMEVAADTRLPIYSGGLGALAGDTLRSFADLKVPVVAVSLLYRNGYFDQVIDARGNQNEHSVAWNPAALLAPLAETVRVSIERRTVLVRAWQYDVKGADGHLVPLLLLDTNVPENSPGDRDITATLYGGDARYRLCQEVVLGIGGVRMLRALGYTRLERFHLNEGHAALLALELLRESAEARSGEPDFRAVRERCVFTTHTPVPAGHDQFSYDLVASVLDQVVPLDTLRMLGGRDRLNMTLLALNLSQHVNGVTKRHGQVTHEMFPGYTIDSVTNGVHSPTWTCDSFRDLFDQHIPGWRQDSFSLRYAIHIPKEQIGEAHLTAKRRLVEEVRRRTGRAFTDEALTVGIARRSAEYKRLDLILSNPDRLVDITEKVGPLQIVFAGKAHPHDGGGKAVIQRIVAAAERLHGRVEVVFLEGYDLDLAKLLTSGTDLWVNTPQPPLEASGTSGMKAAHNGVPQLSVLDGWWIEGHMEGLTGWSIGSAPGRARTATNEEDARELHDKLRWVIAPLYYTDHDVWLGIMRACIAFNASFFNTARMVQQYAAQAYV